MADDDFTMELRLCDDEGMVRGKFLDRHNQLARNRQEEEFACTGHAHLAGEHIRCTSEAHAADELPPDLLRVLRDPSITIPRDAEVWNLKPASPNPEESKP